MHREKTPDAMTKEQQLTRLEVLKQDTLAWQYDKENATWSAAVGDYAIEVRKVHHNGDLSDPLERGNVNAQWSVRHSAYGTLIEPTPAVIALYAKREAVDFVRAHILGQQEPQHA